MSDLYAWASWFRDLARRIAEGGADYLAERVGRVDWSAPNPPALVGMGAENVDPLSFFYTLATRSWPAATREVVYPSVAEQFEVPFEGDLKSDDNFILPMPPAFAALFKDDDRFRPDPLWRLFRSAVKGVEAVDGDDFVAVLGFHGVGMPKLTQALFLVNPDEFLPCDKQTAFGLCGHLTAVKNWSSYRRELPIVRDAFPGLTSYEINRSTFLLSDLISDDEEKRIFSESRNWQIRTNYGSDKVDHAEEMWDSVRVWTRDGLTSGCADPTEPKPGDVVFVRYRHHGRGIGVVLENLHDANEDRAHLDMLWLNRASTEGEKLFAGAINRFTNAAKGAGRKLVEGFRAAPEYRATFDLLEKHGWRWLPPSSRCDLGALAGELLIPATWLRGVARRLADKKQVIFQGPPGTGKTYVARKLARCLAGSDDRVRLVQFHPSYAYEDFVQGFRPTLLENGQAGFEIRDGALLEMAEQAAGEPDEKHYLIIDEINRGNLSKILGELYFLLEYRDAEIRLQHSSQPFSLPPNLFFIGTMNTADRSIALVDLALRRRFAFFEFHPDRPPIRGLLSRWLDQNAKDTAWVAEVVDAANRKLDDRHAALGPSYFMPKEGALDDARVQAIWDHDVLPYIEEHLFGQHDDLKGFQLDRLRNEVRTESGESRTPDAATAAASDPAPGDAAD